MFECVLLIFFINLAIRQHTKTNEFHIFSIFEIDKVSEGHGGEKRDLRHSMANVRLCIAEFSRNFIFPATYENKRI